MTSMLSILILHNGRGGAACGADTTDNHQVTVRRAESSHRSAGDTRRIQRRAVIGSCRRGCDAPPGISYSVSIPKAHDSEGAVGGGGANRWKGKAVSNSRKVSRFISASQATPNVPCTSKHHLGLTSPKTSKERVPPTGGEAVFLREVREKEKQRRRDPHDALCCKISFLLGCFVGNLRGSPQSMKKWSPPPRLDQRDGSRR